MHGDVQHVRRGGHADQFGAEYRPLGEMERAAGLDCRQMVDLIRHFIRWQMADIDDGQWHGRGRLDDLQQFAILFLQMAAQGLVAVDERVQRPLHQTARPGGHRCGTAWAR